MTGDLSAIDQRAGNLERAGIGQTDAIGEGVRAGEHPIGAAVDSSLREIDDVAAETG